jgi:hypothetical protein
VGRLGGLVVAGGDAVRWGHGLIVAGKALKKRPWSVSWKRIQWALSETERGTSDRAGPMMRDRHRSFLGACRHQIKGVISTFVD